MNSRWFRRLLPGLVFLALAGSAAAQTPPPAPLSPFVPGRWWSDSRKTLLGLTDEQSKKIDAIIQITMPNARQKGDELRTMEAELSRMIIADTDEGAIARQVDRVEALRTMLNKNRTLMLVRIRAILTPEQRTKLSLLREQWEKENLPPPGSDRDRGRQGADRDRRPDPPRAPR